MTDKLESRIYEVFENQRFVIDKKCRPEDIISLVNDICCVVRQEENSSKVEQFMNTFNQPVLEVPTIPDKDTYSLRLSLILEELSELAEAGGRQIVSMFIDQVTDKGLELINKLEAGKYNQEANIIEAFDALADLEYVLKGAIHCFGGGEIFDEIFDDVHSSNMSKVCKNVEEASETIQNYAIKGIEVYANKQFSNSYLIYRTSDNKVLKSINYKPVDLTKYFNNGVSDKKNN